MNTKSCSVLGAVLLCVSPLVHAQTGPIKVGIATPVTIKIDTDKNLKQCNVEIEGQGVSRVERVVSSPNFDTSIDVTPPQEGDLNIQWKGKTRVRGFNSTVACTGSGTVVVKAVANIDDSKGAGSTATAPVVSPTAASQPQTQPMKGTEQTYSCKFVDASRPGKFNSPVQISLIELGIEKYSIVWGSTRLDTAAFNKATNVWEGIGISRIKFSNGLVTVVNDKSNLTMNYDCRSVPEGNSSPSLGQTTAQPNSGANIDPRGCRAGEQRLIDDCSKATTDRHRLICENAELKGKFCYLYYSLRLSENGEASRTTELRDSHVKWLKDSHNKCDSLSGDNLAACVDSSVSDRAIDILRTYKPDTKGVITEQTFKKNPQYVAIVSALDQADKKRQAETAALLTAKELARSPLLNRTLFARYVCSFEEAEHIWRNRKMKSDEEEEAQALQMANKFSTDEKKKPFALQFENGVKWDCENMESDPKRPTGVITKVYGRAANPEFVILKTNKSQTNAYYINAWSLIPLSSYLGNIESLRKAEEDQQVKAKAEAVAEAKRMEDPIYRAAKQRQIEAQQRQIEAQNRKMQCFNACTAPSVTADCMSRYHNGSLCGKIAGDCAQRCGAYQ